MPETGHALLRDGHCAGGHRSAALRSRAWNQQGTTLLGKTYQRHFNSHVSAAVQRTSRIKNLVALLDTKSSPL